MAGLLVVIAVGIIALPGLLGSLGRRLAPREWAYLSVVAIGGGMVLLEVGLLLVALPMLLRAAGVPALAEACERVLGPVLVGGWPAAWAAAVAAAVFPLAAIRANRGARAISRCLADELWLGERDRIGTTDVVVLPLGAAFAAALDGDEACIVLSREMQALLTGEQLDAVVRHEAAHLAAGHDAYLVLGAILTSTLGRVLPLKASAVSLRLAVERWADEDAAAGSPSRRAALRSALIDVAHTRATALPIPTLTDADTVIARIDALAQPPSSPRLGAHLFTYAPGTMLGAGALAALGSWGDRVHMVFSMAGSCPA